MNAKKLIRGKRYLIDWAGRREDCEYMGVSVHPVSKEIYHVFVVPMTQPDGFTFMTSTTISAPPGEWGTELWEVYPAEGESNGEGS